MADFIKSHGLGNDYIVMNEANLPFALTAENLMLICDRHLGIGSDGLLLKTSAKNADFGLRIFNPDGSEARKSGNGIRIFARYLHDHGFARSNVFSIETLGGIVNVQLILKGSEVESIVADMGRAEIDPRTMIEIEGTRLPCTILSVGNPHCVVPVAELNHEELLRRGPLIERHPIFPDRTNVQFVKVLGRDRIRIGIWERGAGHTLASGSSACAAATACHHNRLTGGDITVEMEGGVLSVSIAENGEIRMTGPAEEVYQGNLSPTLLRRLTQH